MFYIRFASRIKALCNMSDTLIGIYSRDIGPYPYEETDVDLDHFWSSDTVRHKLFTRIYHIYFQGL